MPQDESLENSLVDTLTNDSIELTGEITELTIDQFIDNELLKEIPFFSIFYKSYKTARGVRDAIFAMKLYKFIKEFDSIKRKDKEGLLHKIEIDKKSRIKIGQTLIMVLDRLVELEKTQITASLFAAYLKAEITNSEFAHLSTIVQNAYLDDLVLFCEIENPNKLKEEVQERLAFVGLMSPFINDIKSMYGSSVEIEKNDYILLHVINPTGMKMRKFALKYKAGS